jgi:hypothetical protein
VREFYLVLQRRSKRETSFPKFLLLFVSVNTLAKSGPDGILFLCSCCEELKLTWLLRTKICFAILFIVVFYRAESEKPRVLLLKIPSISDRRIRSGFYAKVKCGFCGKRSGILKASVRNHFGWLVYSGSN